MKYLRRKNEYVSYAPHIIFDKWCSHLKVVKKKKYKILNVHLTDAIH